jgi:hypothetical protein
MAIDTKNITESADAWADITPGRADKYSARSQLKATEWESGAIGGVPNWKLGVTAAGVDTRMMAGIRRAGAAKYSRKIRDVGGARFGAGVTAAKEDYRSRFEPFLRVIQGVTLGARRPRGDPANYLRMQAVGEALHKARLAAAASGG